MKKFFLVITIMLLAPMAFAKSKPQIEGGYVGSLPNVTERFQSAQPKESKPLFESIDGFDDRNQIKPAPRDNPAFVNIILKKDKTSQYVNDINYMVILLEKLEKLIEDNADTQKFNASAYFFKENVEYLRDKYQNKSEESYISFKKLMQINMQVQTVAQLRSEGSIYSPYLPYTDKGYIYNPNNIDKQLEYLLKQIQDTLIVLKEAN